MAEAFTIEDIRRIPRIRPMEGEQYVCVVSRYFYKEMRIATDPFQIYKQRRMLAKVMPGVVIDRGEEWWHG